MPQVTVLGATDAQEQFPAAAPHAFSEDVVPIRTPQSVLADSFVCFCSNPSQQPASCPGGFVKRRKNGTIVESCILTALFASATNFSFFDKEHCSCHV